MYIPLPVFWALFHQQVNFSFVSVIKAIKFLHLIAKIFISRLLRKKRMEGKLRAVLFPNLIHRAGKKYISVYSSGMGGKGGKFLLNRIMYLRFLSRGVVQFLRLFLFIIRDQVGLFKQSRWMVIW